MLQYINVYIYTLTRDAGPKTTHSDHDPRPTVLSMSCGLVYWHAVRFNLTL